ncbi:hypothetical protein INT43_000028, partial [Umbelopsis isabellina]
MQPFNKYYPPDWTPEKGSVNKHVGKHPLGDRARKIDQGILIVRFELPFNIWCEGCDNHIGMGVRYNAQKKKIGNYYSTPIWSFRMKCHLCDNWIEIHTNPKDAQYVVMSGARQKLEEWEPEDSEVIRLKDDALVEKMANDAFFKLEHDVQDEKKASETVPILTQLQRLNDSQWSDPYTLSQQLRRKFRDQKKLDKARQEKADHLRDKMSLNIDLLDENPEDEIKAKLTEFDDPIVTGAEKRKKELQVAPLFTKRTRHLQNDLASRVVTHTRHKVDPFLTNTTSSYNTLPGVLLKGKTTHGSGHGESEAESSKLVPVKNSRISLVSTDYTESDSEDD